MGAPSSQVLDLAARFRTEQRTIRSQVARPGALLDVVRAVNESLEPRHVAAQAITCAASWLPVACWALVATDASGALSLLAERELDTALIPHMQAIAGWVTARREEFASADRRADTRVSSESAASVIAFPLVCRGRCIGALIGLDAAASSREPRLAAGLARAIQVLLEPVAAALDSTLHLQRAQALSVTDDLTHLYNSRYLTEALRRETKRASRSGRPISLLFIDLDGFKAVNDNHGHLRGSQALVEAAAVIRGSARETDVVARFGGDEFAVILPDTGTGGALAVGERIRERLAAHPFLAAEQLNLHVTASVGVATLPDVASSADELVHAADFAMYEVKHQGKNGIQVAAIEPINDRADK